MKAKLLALGVIVTLLLAGGLFAVDAQKGGNGGPKPGTDFNGPHFNLNLIGKSKEMPGDYDNPDRHVMFVPLDTAGFYIDLEEPNNLGEETLDGIKIEMTQSSEEDGWAMIDGDATDGYGAFQLGWVEALDNVGALWYYIDVGTVSISKGKNKWTDATDLFFVDTTEDYLGFLIGDEANYFSEYGGMWVFEYMSGLDAWTPYDEFGNLIYDFSDLAYFWQFVNHGNKLIQVRFYKI